MPKTNNLGSMSIDLGFTDARGRPAPGVDRYSIITLVFFIPYVLFQPPATVVLRKVGPRIFLPLITLLWGGVMIVSANTNELPYACANRAARLSVSSRSGRRWLVFVSSSVSWKLVSSQDAPTSCPLGTLVMSSRSATPSFT